MKCLDQILLSALGVYNSEEFVWLNCSAIILLISTVSPLLMDWVNLRFAFALYEKKSYL